MLGYIYAITNKINGKKYIGKTFDAIEDRFQKHVYDSHRERYKNRPLYRAFKKYGEENFIIENVETIKVLNLTDDVVSDREIFWIKFYDSFHTGYNATLGGEGKRRLRVHDTEVINKYKEIGCVREVAKYFNISASMARIIIRRNGIQTNKPSDNITKIRMLNNDNSIDITFNSINEAAEWVEKSKHTSATKKHIIGRIYKVIYGKEPSYFGYKFYQIS